jgi:uncharacterized protein (DUF1330 family)
MARMATTTCRAQIEMQNHHAWNKREYVELERTDFFAREHHDGRASIMTVYVIVQLKMTDRAAYDRYQARFFDVFKKFSGRLLSADERPSVLEGKWDRDKLVLMSFPDEAAFRAWSDSPEYLEISRDRKAGAEGIVLLARGFSP